MNGFETELPFVFNALEPMLQKGYYHPIILPLALPDLVPPSSWTTGNMTASDKAKALYGNCEAKAFLEHCVSVKKALNAVLAGSDGCGAHSPARHPGYERRTLARRRPGDS